MPHQHIGYTVIVIAKGLPVEISGRHGNCDQYETDWLKLKDKLKVCV